MSIGGVLQILALLAFALGVFGVVRLVMALTQRQSWRAEMGMAVLGLGLGAVLLVASSWVLEVGVTQTGVIYDTITGDLRDPIGPGISFLGPWNRVTFYPSNKQEYTMSGLANEGAREGKDQVEARSVDGQKVYMDITVIYRIPAANVNRIHQDWNGSVDQEAYKESFIRPVIRSIVRDVVSGFQAEEIYGLKRNDVQTQIEDELRASFAEGGFELDQVLTRNISFTDEFTQAIEDKQIEEQKLEQAQTAAERREAEAKGNANAAIETARGDAEARLVQARAEAEGLRLISDQLAANPNLLQYIYIQSLGDNVNLAIIPSNSPFLFDSSTFTDLADDFVAPQVPALVPTPEGE